MRRLEDSLLKQLKTGKSIFARVPDNIGEIIYCDTTTPKREADSKETTRKKVLWSVVIPMVITLLCWLFFWGNTVLLICVTAGMAIVTAFSIYMSRHFFGIDKFIGTEGFAIYHFSETRENVKIEKQVLFKDVDDFVVTNESHVDHMFLLRPTTPTKNTKYKVMVWYHNGEKETLIDVEGTNYTEDNNDYEPDSDKRFWKKVVEAWTEWKFAQLQAEFKSGKPISFNIYERDGERIRRDFLVLNTDNITIGKISFGKDKIDQYEVTDNDLVLYTNEIVNRFGFDRYKEIKIPLKEIGNASVFHRCLIIYFE